MLEQIKMTYFILPKKIPIATLWTGGTLSLQQLNTLPERHLSHSLLTRKGIRHDVIVKFAPEHFSSTHKWTLISQQRYRELYLYKILHGLGVWMCVSLCVCSGHSVCVCVCAGVKGQSMAGVCVCVCRDCLSCCWTSRGCLAGQSRTRVSRLFIGPVV